MTSIQFSLERGASAGGVAGDSYGTEFSRREGEAGVEGLLVIARGNELAGGAG